jgi:hypothetical protein
MAALTRGSCLLVLSVRMPNLLLPKEFRLICNESLKLEFVEFELKFKTIQKMVYYHSDDWNFEDCGFSIMRLKIRWSSNKKIIFCFCEKVAYCTKLVYNITLYWPTLTHHRTCARSRINYSTNAFPCSVAPSLGISIQLKFSETPFCLKNIYLIPQPIFFLSKRKQTSALLHNFRSSHSSCAVLGTYEQQTRDAKVCTLLSEMEWLSGGLDFLFPTFNCSVY